MTDTTQGNITLALFMGYKRHNHVSYITYENAKGQHIYEFVLQYHSDWNWLHEAWQKFRDLKTDNSYEHLRRSLHLMSLITLDSISDAFTALVEAVEWWNGVNEKEVGNAAE